MSRQSIFAALTDFRMRTAIGEQCHYVATDAQWRALERELAIVQSTENPYRTDAVIAAEVAETKKMLESTQDPRDVLEWKLRTSAIPYGIQKCLQWIASKIYDHGFTDGRKKE